VDVAAMVEGAVSRRDKDGNRYAADLIDLESPYNESATHRGPFVVGIHANGAWLTLTQAEAFARRINRIVATARLRALRRKSRRGSR
jgi:hypothetical protein